MLDTVVPQLGRDITEAPGQGAQGFVAHWELLARLSGLDVHYMQEEVFGRRRREREAEAAEPAEASESQSSNKMGKKGKRRKRRKKKLPKIPSSSPRRGGCMDEMGIKEKVIRGDMEGIHPQARTPGEGSVQRPPTLVRTALSELLA